MLISKPFGGSERYIYDIRWVEGWNSIYGHGTEKSFVQLWAALPQHTSTMAHLLQQGAVMSTSFQPYEVPMMAKRARVLPWSLGPPAVSLALPRLLWPGWHARPRDLF